MPTPTQLSRAYAGRVRERAAGANPGRDLHARFMRARAVALAAARYLERQLYLASAGIIPRRGIAQHDVFEELHSRLIRTYAADPYPARAVLFASRSYIDHTRQVLDHVLPPESDGGNRAKALVACEHIDLVREPNVADVARALGALLAPGSARSASA